MKNTYQYKSENNLEQRIVLGVKIIRRVLGSYQRGLASMVYNFFDRKSASLNKSSGSGIVNESNYQLANKLHRPIIKKF